MTQEHDFKLLNIPAIMDRRVLVQDETGQMVSGRTWHERVLCQFDSLYQFHIQQGLVTDQFAQSAPPIAHLVVRRSDLTPLGWALWQSGAVDRWLGSFDRSPNKSLSNYKIMETALAKITSAAA